MEKTPLQASKKYALLARAKEIKASKKRKEVLKAQHFTETEALKAVITQELKKGPNNDKLSSFVDDINSKDRFRRHIGIIGIRKLLCQEQNPPIQRIIGAGLVPKLLEFSQYHHEPHLALEAIWNLTNIASGTTEQTKFIIEKGAIICLVNNLKHPNLKIAEQAIWALGNIAGDSPDLRDAVLKWGAISPLIKCFQKTNKSQIIKHGAWMLSNLCRGRRPPSLSYVELALEPLCNILKQSHDNDTIIDTAWALSSLLDHESLIDRFLATRANDALVSHLNNPLLSVLTPCLRAVGNIASGTDEQTQILISHPGLLPRLMALVTNPKMAVRREVCWILSNIAAVNGQFMQILENSIYFEQILTVAQTDATEVRREALWIFGNAVNSHALHEIAVEIQIQILTCFVDSLDIQDAKGLSICVEGIMCMLSSENQEGGGGGGGKRIIFEFLQEAAIKQKISDLRQDMNLDVSKNAKKIIQLLSSQ